VRNLIGIYLILLVSMFSIMTADLTGEESGGIIIEDFLVNDDTLGGCAHYTPDMAGTQSGNFIITWIDERRVTGDIYARGFDPVGNPTGETRPARNSW